MLKSHFKSYRTAGFILAAIILCVLSEAPAVRADLPTFQRGDVFVAVGNGKVQWRRPDGTLVSTLQGPTGGGENSGMAFDSTGNLYVTGFTDDEVTVFNTHGVLLGTFGQDYDSDPESILFDAAGNAYVGQADGGTALLKFDATGNLIRSFTPPVEDRGIDWIDLAADQRTLYYTSEGASVLRYDLNADAPLSDFTDGLPGDSAYALRLLPGGGVLVADTETIERLDSTGADIQTYDAPGEDNWFALNLDPDGKSFWSADQTTGHVYRFDIATGSIISSFDAMPDVDVAGIAVAGEIATARPPTVAFEFPTPGLTTKTLSTISGTVLDNSGTGIKSVVLYLQRLADHTYWNATAWSSTEGGFPATVTNGQWSQTSGLPSGANLTPGDYAIEAYAYDNTGKYGFAQNSFTISTTPVPPNNHKIILIKGTWNKTDYDVLYAKLLDLGYTDADILVTKLSDTGMRSIADSDQYIAQQILTKWTDEKFPLDVDIVAHSAGGLAARRLINRGIISGGISFGGISFGRQNIPFSSVCRVHNLITLGTPLGGIRACRWMTNIPDFAAASFLTDQRIFFDMRSDVANGNSDYSSGPGDGFFGDHDASSNRSLITYWGLGGNTPIPDALKDPNGVLGVDWGAVLYHGAGTIERRDYDGLVNVASAHGEEADEDHSIYCDQPNFRILNINHNHLPTGDPQNHPTVDPVDDYILPALLGDGPGRSWPLTCPPGSTRAAAPDSSPQVVGSFDSPLTQNKTLTYLFPIDGCSAATFDLLTDSACTFTLVAPDGTIVTPATSDPSVSYTTIVDPSGSNTSTYVIGNPAAGKWTAQLTPTAVPASGGAAVVTVAVVNSVGLSGASDHGEYSNGDTPLLTAKFLEDTTPLTNVKIFANIEDPTSHSSTLTLSPSGADDGSYTLQMSNLTTGGIYDVTFTALGTNAAGQQALREATSSFTVATDSASLGGEYTDQGVDMNKDGVLDFLQVNVPVNVSTAGGFVVKADLLDGAGAIIDSATGTGVNLAIGADSVPVMFDGRRILQHGSPGPYTVSNVRLYDDQPGRPIYILTDNSGYTTGTYNLVQFDHPPTVSIQQPDANLPTADRLFNIQFKALATDTPATVDLYYATDNSGANGQIIVRGLEASGAQTFGWDTSSIPPGDYYIYAVCSDGVLTPVTAVSTGAARVIHAAPTVTSTSPGTLALGASGVNVVVTGTALGTSTSSVSFLRSGNPDPAITVSDVQVSQDQTSLTASVTVAGTAIPGPRTVVVSTVVGASAAASSPGSTILVGLPDSYTIPAGLQLLSSPFQYNETSFTVLFGLPKVDAAVWAPGANQYAFSPNSPADTFHPGAAVWIQLKAPVTVHPQGFAAPDGQPFKIDLQTGWNMIGDPFPAPIPLAGVSLVDAGGQTTPYAAAVTAGDASPLYAFDTSQKQYAATGASGSIQPWAGYWLMVDAPGTLVVPPP